VADIADGALVSRYDQSKYADRLTFAPRPHVQAHIPVSNSEIPPRRVDQRNASQQSDAHCAAVPYLMPSFALYAVALVAAADGDKVAPHGVRALGCLFAALPPGWFLPT